MLSSKDEHQIVLALRLIGNFASASQNEYIINIFKNGLIENLIIAWQQLEGLIDPEKEVGWILSNIVGSYD